ncbi:MAG: hypothetical protein KDD60_09755, partial [Bdellovibrionales bacterium]|nr:hypothetical protein [Bdellovibrionales bacterium]
YLNYGGLLSPAVVFFYHSANDPRNNVTLHRMRRPFGKGAFAPTPNAQLQQIGFPIPDYPLCSHFGLNEYFEIARFDFPHQRAFCLLQSVIFEHSALFSLVSINIARLPMLTSKLYNLGSTSEDPRDNEYPFELTTAILASFISEVKKDGATFVLFGERKHLLRLDLQRLQQLTSSIYFQEEALGNGPMEPWIFKHDAHFNSKGHEKLADFLIPKLISELKVLPESVP